MSLVRGLREHFSPGLRYIVGWPRSGKTDLLRQAYLLQAQDRGGPAPVWLRTSALPEGEQFVSQLIAFRGGHLSWPGVTLDRAALREQPDVVVLEEILGAAGQGEPERFFAAAGRWAARGGPLCLYLDDAPASWLRAASGWFGIPLAILATGPPALAPAEAEGIPLQDFSLRETVLLGENIARQQGLDYSGEAAEGFCAYLHQDPWAISSSVLHAARRQAPLTREEHFAAAYLEELVGGSLGHYFHRLLDGLGAPEHAFALEWLAAGGSLEEADLAAWRRRADVEAVRTRLRQIELLDRPWTPARDWAETRRHDPVTAQARLLARLLEDFDSARRAEREARVYDRMAAGLRRLTPAAQLWLAEQGIPGTQVPEVCAVARQALAGGVLLLAFGRPSSAVSLLAVGVLGGGEADPPFEEMRRRVAALAPDPARVERWLVLRQPREQAAYLAREAGFRLLDYDLFNRLLSEPSREDADRAAGREEVSLELPLAADFEIPAVRVLDHLLERHGVEKRTAAQARIALVEACLNAIEHGRRPGTTAAAPASSMEVRLAVGAEEITVTVSNPGPPFQPAEGERGSAMARGHGLKIIHSLMDSVSYESDLEGTRVVMKKRISASEGTISHAQTGSGLETN